MVKTFHVTSNNTTVEVVSDERVEELEKMCSYQDPDYMYKKEWYLKQTEKTGMDVSWIKDWDGTKRLYDVMKEGSKFRYMIPIGLLDPVLSLLNLCGDVEYVAQRFIKEVVSIADVHIKKVVRLRDDDQREGERAIREADGRGVIEAVTGFGKTILGIDTIQKFSVPTIILANTKVIIRQWDERIQEYFNLYRYSSGTTKIFTTSKYRSFAKAMEHPEDVLIVVASTSSIHRAMTGMSSRGVKESTREKYRNITSWIMQVCDMLIFDEVHEAGSRTAVEVLEMMNCYYRLGFSATVMSREDMRDIEYISRIGSVIFTRLNIHVRKKESIPLKFMRVSGMSFGRRTPYENIYDTYIVHNRERNDIIIDIIDMCLDEGRRVLVLVEKLDHARILSGMSGFPYSYSTDPERKRKFSMFHSGDEPVMICTYKLVGTGYDHPMLDTVVLAGGGKSKNKEIQAVGRIMRDVEGKKSKQVFDFADNCNKLRDHSVERYSIWKKEMVFSVDVSGTYLERL